MALKTTKVEITPATFLQYMGALDKEGQVLQLQNETANRFELWIDGESTATEIEFRSDGTWFATTHIA